MNLAVSVSGVARVLAVLLFSFAGRSTLAQAVSEAPAQVYTLIEGSQLVDDCPICDRLPIVLPLRGTFELRLLEQNPLFATYHLDSIAFTATNEWGTKYQVVGSGTYTFGGELLYLQQLLLDLQIQNGIGWDNCLFTNDSSLVSRPWPMFQNANDQTNGTEVQQYRLELNAAPFREIWFSTAKAFEAGSWSPPTNAISDGDLLATGGRVVKRNHELSARLGIPPVVPDVGLKDIDIQAGGEIVFSMERDVVSETLGMLNHGDLLTDSGRLLYLNQELLAQFPPEPPFPPDIGLAAVQVLDTGDVYFSVQTSYFAEQPGIIIQTGDLLSQSGRVVRTGTELLSAFRPLDPKRDYGLTAVYCWPTNEWSGVGEIWFATRETFQNETSTFEAGDLLSDQGYVVFRNKELVGGLSPTIAGPLGLDALHVVTDVTPPPESPLEHRPPLLTNTPPQSLLLQWSGWGKVYQVEKAARVEGPFRPLSPITTESRFIDAGVLTNTGDAFYRVRQW